MINQMTNANNKRISPTEPTSSSTYIGCAGWAIHRTAREQFATDGTHLQQYATRFNAVEINSSFYRPHRPATYQRWSASVPPEFRFSVKIPKVITHERQLQNVTDVFDGFLSEASGLREKLGCLLIQLPPKLEYNEQTVVEFLTMVRARYEGTIVMEPRHASWFTEPVNAMFIEHSISRVAADPSLNPGADTPNGDVRTVYFRLHGSPRTYYSAYSDEFLQTMELRMREWLDRGSQTWCIFDNTALGAAALDALELTRRMSLNTIAGPPLSP